MNRCDANLFLDRVREGSVSASEASITYALRCTGDIGEPDQPRAAAQPEPAMVLAMNHPNRAPRVPQEAAA